LFPLLRDGDRILHNGSQHPEAQAELSNQPAVIFGSARLRLSAIPEFWKLTLPEVQRGS
jgi:hypothetical protein